MPLTGGSQPYSDATFEFRLFCPAIQITQGVCGDLSVSTARIPITASQQGAVNLDRLCSQEEYLILRNPIHSGNLQATFQTLDIRVRLFSLIFCLPGYLQGTHLLIRQTCGVDLRQPRFNLFLHSGIGATDSAKSLSASILRHYLG